MIVLWQEAELSTELMVFIKLVVDTNVLILAGFLWEEVTKVK